MLCTEFEDMLMDYSDRHKELNGFRPDAEDYRYYRENPSELPIALEFLRQELAEALRRERLEEQHREEWIPEPDQD